MDSGYRERVKIQRIRMLPHLWELNREDTGDINRDSQRFTHKAEGRYSATLFIKRENWQ